MTIRQLIDRLSLRVLAGGASAETQLQGCYIGDLLSRVISRSVQGGLWITIMNNLNVAAVACWLTSPAFCWPKGSKPRRTCAKKCAEEGIFLLGSDRSVMSWPPLMRKTSHEAVLRLSHALLPVALCRG